MPKAKIKPTYPIYLDNNGTTLICTPAQREYEKWLACYNPSSDSRFAKPAKQMLEKAQKYILDHCGVPTGYTAVFTSGGTESNCFILRSTTTAYRKRMGVKPHIVISSIEHHSIIECVESLEKYDEAEATKVEPSIYGIVKPEDVVSAIKPNTCIVSIIYANNETGSINNIPKIAELVHAKNIPFHTDSVQIFGKKKIDMRKEGIDALSVSFHKLYGPKGVGLLIINDQLVHGYGLCAEINGSQQNGLRGGTENIPGIASSISAMKWNFSNRKTKNKKLHDLTQRIVSKLPWNIGSYKNYISGTPSVPFEVVVLGPPLDKEDFRMPNTLLLSFVNNKNKFCNVDLKKELDKKGVIVSVGSACLTKNKKASHVLDALKAPSVIRRGVIRISVGDYNTAKEIDRFIEILEKAVLKQL